MKTLWREAAIRNLPAQESLINEAESLGDLWMDLVPIFGAAHGSLTEDGTIQGVWGFAEWSTLESNDREIANACFCHFLEHLNQFGPEVRARTQIHPGMAQVERMRLSASDLWAQ